MEKQAVYGNDPTIEVSDSIDLGNNQEFSFTLRIRKSQQEHAQREIDILIQKLKK